MHSPILYAFCRQVLDDRRSFYAFDELEGWRKQLLSNQEQIQRADFGAGSKILSSPNQSVSAIAKSSLSQPWKCRFLFRLVQWWHPDLIVEFGTSLGISTAYMSASCKPCPIITIDGDSKLQMVAQTGWVHLGLNHIEPWHSSFEDALLRVPWSKPDRLLIFLDGDHRPDRIEAILHHIYSHSRTPFIVILDDIRWSEEMWAGWCKWIRQWPVGAWLDLFQGGIWIHDPAFQDMQHQVLIPSRFKPLRFGWI
ncbi:MAG: class I SAM-dependent methyltransferase [Saprospiraceae bacterium]|nr:class I SAM-dependent methyltransferase [Saprospiraceae bacterium]